MTYCESPQVSVDAPETLAHGIPKPPVTGSWKIATWGVRNVKATNKAAIMIIKMSEIFSHLQGGFDILNCRAS